MNKKDIQDYFSFTRQERRGIVVLCILIILCWCVPVIVEYLHQDKQVDFSVFEKEVALFQQQQDSLKLITASNRNDRKNSYSTNILNDHELPEPFSFDPNTLSDEGWQRLGVTSRVIHTIQNYRKAGGQFHKKEDLKKIYGLSSDMYQHLEPFIHIAQKEVLKNKKADVIPDTTYAGYPKQTNFFKNKYKDENLVIDVNTADSTQWMKLRGIGPALSSRIIRFRHSLGGFYKIEQIAEVYGLPDSTFQHIKQQLNILSFDLKKLNINTATVEELKSHPYIGYRLAASIKAFRDQHGPFQHIEDLQQLQLVNDQIYRKLAAYLSVN